MTVLIVSNIFDINKNTLQAMLCGRLKNKRPALK